MSGRLTNRRTSQTVEFNGCGCVVVLLTFLFLAFTGALYLLGALA